MNMNLDIVNRALFATGQNLITADEESSVYNLCKSYYLTTFLEALSEVEWVGGRKRDKLARTGRPVLNNQKYRFAYDMPFDCAKAIELQDNEYFIVEDRLILTDAPDAELLYVSNGRILKPIATAVMELGMLPEHEYFSAGPPGTKQDYTLHPGGLEDITECPIGSECQGEHEGLEIEAVLPEDPEPDSDYPDYTAIDYEPKFFEYIEKKLAAKLAMKVSENPRLHMQLLQEALLVKQEAVDASRASRAAKVKENSWWSDELGLRS